jgi:hypothetical protein
VSAGVDRWIKWTTTGCVGLLALIAGTVSYLHMHTRVTLHGQLGWVAGQTPLSVDGMIVAASPRCWRTPALSQRRGAAVGTTGRREHRQPPTDQQGINRKLVRVLELQAEDLIAADDQRRRAQASQVLLRRGVQDRDMRLGQVDALLTGQQHNPVAVMRVENSSGQPVYDAELRWEMDGIPAGVPDQLGTLATGMTEPPPRPIPPGTRACSLRLCASAMPQESGGNAVLMGNPPN